MVMEYMRQQQVLSSWELLAGAIHTGGSHLMVATLADP